MMFSKVGTFIITKEPHVMSVYRRTGSAIECFLVYRGGDTYYELYTHDHELECFDNWQGLQETLEAETVRMVGAK